MGASRLQGVHSEVGQGDPEQTPAVYEQAELQAEEAAEVDRGLPHLPRSVLGDPQPAEPEPGRYE